MSTLFKGQGMIAEIILFAMSIVMALTMFIMLSTADAEFEQNVRLQIESGLESVSDRSVVTVVLNDNVWRAQTVNNRYNDLTALELTSYYFSTEDDIHIHGEDYSRDQIESDLEDYYMYKLNQNFLSRPDQQDWEFRVRGHDDEIIVSNNQGREGNWNSMRIPFQLSDGEVGEIQLWVRGTGGVFSVE